MWDMITFIGGLIVVLFLLELLDLPELLAKRLKKRVSKDELEQKLREIETRLQKLEANDVGSGS